MSACPSSELRWRSTQKQIKNPGFGGPSTPVALTLETAASAQENILKLSVDGVAVVREPSRLILVAHALPVVPGEGAAGRAGLQGAVHAAKRV